MGTGSFRDGNKSGKEEFGSRGGRIEDRGRTNDSGNEPDPRKTGVGVLDAADEFFQQEQTLQNPNIPTERPVDRFDPQNPGERRHHRNPNDDERPPPSLKSQEEEAPIIPGDPNDLGARGARRRSKDDINASPVLRRGLLGV